MGWEKQRIQAFSPVLQPERIYQSMLTKATHTSDISAVICNTIWTVEEEHRQPNSVFPKNFSPRVGKSQAHGFAILSLGRMVYAAPRAIMYPGICSEPYILSAKILLPVVSTPDNNSNVR